MPLPYRFTVVPEHNCAKKQQMEPNSKKMVLNLKEQTNLDGTV